MDRQQWERSHFGVLTNAEFVLDPWVGEVPGDGWITSTARINLFGCPAGYGLAVQERGRYLLRCLRIFYFFIHALSTGFAGSAVICRSAQ